MEYRRCFFFFFYKDSDRFSYNLATQLLTEAYAQREKRERSKAADEVRLILKNARYLR